MWLTETRNAQHFSLREDKKPWTVKNIWAQSAEQQGRTAEQESRDNAMFLKAQMELALLGSRPDLVPEWAKGPYSGPIKRMDAAK
jgi:hypothetical protein